MAQQQDEMDRLFAEWQIKNQNTAGYYAATTVAIVALFTLVHWIPVCFDSAISDASPLRMPWRRVMIPIQQYAQARSFGKLKLVPQRLILVLLYLSLNVSLIFYDRPDKSPMVLSIVAKRLAWMTLCNLCLVVFLSLKNTPLSPLTGHSFETVNGFHRISAYSTIILMIFHSSLEMSALAQYPGVLRELMTQFNQVAGAIAGLSMIIMFATAVGCVRRRRYELFYAVHIVMAALVLIAVGLHRPDLSKKAVLITIISVIMCVADQALRGARWTYFGLNNYCVLTPLPGGATRVTLRRQMKAQPGSSAFLWIPRLGLFQRHPFTLINSEPTAEFVVIARNGFTRALYQEACSTPGIKLRASVDGPYGHVFDAHHYDKVILFAGGSGVTFTLSVALDWTRKRRTPKDNRTLDFIWVVRHRTMLSWFTAEFKELQSNPRVHLIIHVSNDAAPSITAPLPPFQDMNVNGHTKNPKTVKASYRISGKLCDPLVPLPIPTRPGRPDVHTLIKRGTLNMSPEARVLVAACGPEGLLHSTSQATTELRRVDAPSIRLYLEQFSI